MVSATESDDAMTPASPLLSAYHRLTSTDINELHDAVEPLAVGHDLQAYDSRAPLDGLVNGLTLESVSLVWVRYGGAGVLVDTPPTQGSFALCAPLAPMGVEYRLTGRRETAADHLVLSHDEPMRMSPDPRAGCLVIATSTARLSDHLAEYLGYATRQPLRFDGVDGPGVTPIVALRRTWQHICALLDQAVTEGVHPLAARTFEQSLLSAILLGLPHTATPDLLSHTPRSRHQTADQIRDWLEAHQADAIGVADVSAAVGLSIRSVEAICREHWHETPTRLLRGIRLDQARRALLTAEPVPRSIVEVANAAGFNRIDRFTSAYRQRFGETPAHTITSGGRLGRGGAARLDRPA